MIMPVFVSSWMSILANTLCAGPPRASTLPLRMLLVRLLLIISGCAVLTSPANAQITRTLTNTDEAGFGGVLSGCGSPLVRTFFVTSNFIIGDVDLGVFITHTKRGDIRLTLESPQGTRRQIVNDNDSVSGNNLSVRLNDGAAQVVNTDGAAANHSSAAVPPYQNNFRPNASLSIFNGEQSNGTWRLEICDNGFLFDSGTFRRSDLYITPATNARGTGATFVVTSTANTGNRTLRQAIVDANATPDADDIDFAISGAGPHTITLTSALPDISDNGVAINGTTQSGTQCRDLWAGSGHVLRVNVRGSSGFDGFRLGGANQTIRGLSISGFNNAIVPLGGSTNAAIQCNYLGLLADGTANANGGRGVEVYGAGARIGGLGAGQGNVISSNNIAGIVTTVGSTDTSIQGNFIGTDPTGMSARGNGGGINHFFGAATWRDITRNLIAANGYGIALETDDSLSASTDQIRIQQNRFNFTRTMSALLVSGGLPAINFAAGSISNVLIGGNSASEGNEIGAALDGIALRGVSNIRIRGNTIARNGSRGIWVENSSNIAIGGTAGTEGNRIGGNASDGIRVLGNSSGITILGNLIQPLVITGGTFANGDHGIAIDNASNVVIGDGTVSGRNLISGNRRRGIQGSGTNSAITINGNYIGTDATGNVAVANGDLSGTSQKDAVAFDSGSVSNVSVLNNVIGGYASALVEFFHISSVGITIQGNNIGVGADGTSRIVFDNTEDLVWIGGNPRTHNNVLIGGTAPGQGNIVAFSTRSGIYVDSTGSNIQVIGNTVRNNTRNGINVLQSTKAAVISNRVYDNGLIGIDLGENGVTANDAGDGDGGANDLLNVPAITAVNVRASDQLAYAFTLDVPAAASGYRVEFFASSAADPTGFGEGERYLGHVDIVHNGGSQSYSGTMTSLVPISIGSIISATATRKTAGGAWDITSEFSATATAQGVAELNVALATEPYDQGSGAAFSTPGSDVSLTATVTNTGSGSTQSNSIFTVISINNASSFFNAETPAFGGIVRFASTSPTLTFTPGTDLRFSNAATAPTDFAQCTYTPAAGYDPLVRYVCLNPKGSLPHSAPQNQFSVQLRARIN